MSFANRRGLLIGAGMALGLLLFYLAPLPLAARAAGLGLFAALALLQPRLALLFVPLTAPLYLIPAALAGLRASELLFPLHEVALAITAAAAGARWLARAVAGRTVQGLGLAGARSLLGREHLPVLLFLAAGLWGTVIALPEARGEALRELRWLVLEPVLYYLLLRTLHPSPARMAVLALIAAGVAVALLGLAQLAGVDLVPLIGQKRSFSENVVAAGSVRRVASVYGHPNNLGLFLGRIWPLAAALALSGLWLRSAGSRPSPSERGEPADPGAHWVYAVAALTCLGGLFASFSRGAWLGAAVAGAALLLGRARQRPAGRLIIIAACAAALVLLGLMLRGGGGSEQARLLLWHEAAGYLARHPLGIGLDQFYAYHLPDSGRSLIDPTLLGTSEQYAAHPHNLLLDIWLRMGPLGLLALGWLTVRALRRAWARGRGLSGDALALGALATLAAALTHGLVDHFYFVPDLAIVFWSLVAYVGQDNLPQPARSPTLP